jgi:hypothetical protein
MYKIIEILLINIRITLAVTKLTSNVLRVAGPQMIGL